MSGFRLMTEAEFSPIFAPRKPPPRPKIKPPTHWTSVLSLTAPRNPETGQQKLPAEVDDKDEGTKTKGRSRKAEKDDSDSRRATKSKSIARDGKEKKMRQRSKKVPVETPQRGRKPRADKKSTKSSASLKSAAILGMEELSLVQGEPERRDRSLESKKTDSELEGRLSSSTSSQRMRGTAVKGLEEPLESKKTPPSRATIPSSKQQNPKEKEKTQKPQAAKDDTLTLGSPTFAPPTMASAQEQKNLNKQVVKEDSLMLASPPTMAAAEEQHNVKQVVKDDSLMLASPPTMAAAEEQHDVKQHVVMDDTPTLASPPTMAAAEEQHNVKQHVVKDHAPTLASPPTMAAAKEQGNVNTPEKQLIPSSPPAVVEEEARVPQQVAVESAKIPYVTDSPSQETWSVPKVPHSRTQSVGRKRRNPPPQVEEIRRPDEPQATVAEGTAESPMHAQITDSPWMSHNNGSSTSTGLMGMDAEALSWNLGFAPAEFQEVMRRCSVDPGMVKMDAGRAVHTQVAYTPTHFSNNVGWPNNMTGVHTGIASSQYGNASFGFQQVAPRSEVDAHLAKLDPRSAMHAQVQRSPSSSPTKETWTPNVMGFHTEAATRKRVAPADLPKVTSQTPELIAFVETAIHDGATPAKQWNSRPIPSYHYQTSQHNITGVGTSGCQLEQGPGSCDSGYDSRPSSAGIAGRRQPRCIPVQGPNCPYQPPAQYASRTQSSVWDEIDKFMNALEGEKKTKETSGEEAFKWMLEITVYLAAVSQKRGYYGPPTNGMCSRCRSTHIIISSNKKYEENLDMSKVTYFSSLHIRAMHNIFELNVLDSPPPEAFPNFEHFLDYLAQGCPSVAYVALLVAFVEARKKLLLSYPVGDQELENHARLVLNELHLLTWNCVIPWARYWKQVVEECSLPEECTTLLFYINDKIFDSMRFGQPIICDRDFNAQLILEIVQKMTASRTPALDLPAILATNLLPFFWHSEKQRPAVLKLLTALNTLSPPYYYQCIRSLRDLKRV
ncbi:hypothetical protein QR680_000333 [Steinernema hermaphroditum]|uniref:Uncharacterized protein n=1 Tax=Steinernema hermaphroditum TaxID=289476 RepID=A0AA39LE33_9BILA|nr:hypothetical protein QR680_000333 [Steinernema hermaphroditum]